MHSLALHIGRKGPYRQRVDLRPHLLAQGLIDHLVLSDDTLASERAANNHGLEVPAIARNPRFRSGYSRFDQSLNIFRLRHRLSISGPD